MNRTRTFPGGKRILPPKQKVAKVSHCQRRQGPLWLLWAEKGFIMAGSHARNRRQTDKERKQGEKQKELAGHTFPDIASWQRSPVR